ncbi:MAG: 23S rRNA (adenine(2503)-C(2))-methyltransferase RlmN [Bacteroidaceae bacterium]|nr:23S rRNA (adenine(2503)-C(2))-methyltransferase RlmN [Bacteroidaceae bacterium]
MEEEKKSLLGCTLAELRDVVSQMGMPAFTAKQLMEWIYKKRVSSIDAMTNISKAHKEVLSQHFILGVVPPEERLESVDGTVKYLFRIREGQYVEAVFIPSIGEDSNEERATLCISSQVGCKMHCRFCMTGRQGFSANLTAGEILNQIVAIPESERLTNVVLMGMGEPMDNLDEVLKALSLMTSADGFAWSPKRVTVSTVGIKNTLRRFLKESECHLAISLHASSPAMRAEMMPAERAFSMTEIIRELREFDFSHQRRLSFEYILFAGVNDTPADVRRLVRLLDGLHCRINLIRFHRIPDADFEGVDDERMIAFRDRLTQAGLFTTIRASRGEDVMAACGMLSTMKKKK